MEAMPWERKNNTHVSALSTQQQQHQRAQADVPHLPLDTGHGSLVDASHDAHGSLYSTLKQMLHSSEPMDSTRCLPLPASSAPSVTVVDAVVAGVATARATL